MIKVLLHHTMNHRDLLSLFTSSHRRCSVKKGVLKGFANFTVKHLCWSLLLTTLQVFRAATSLKRAFVHFLLLFLPFFWKIARMPLLSGIGPDVRCENCCQQTLSIFCNNLLCSIHLPLFAAAACLYSKVMTGGVFLHSPTLKDP